jgi:hydroxysqualene dehydroxylase
MIPDVIVIGGGLSGLSAAVKLSNLGAKILLCEQKPNLGGRTYSFFDKKTGDVVDNGQHLLVGACHKTIEYLKTIGTHDFLKIQERPNLNFYHPTRGITAFKIPSLPKPFDLIVAMLKYQGLSFRERQELLKVGIALRRMDQKSEANLLHQTAEEWLITLKQSDVVRRTFWYPMLVSVMNELPNQASAFLFARSLNKSFLGNQSDAALLMPVVGQSELFVNHAEELIKKNHGKVFKGLGAKRIIIENSKVTGVELDRKLVTKYVVCSVPYFGLQKIIPNEVMQMSPFNKVFSFKSSPIIGINLWFDREVMDIDFLGLIDKDIHWVFNKRRIMCEIQKPENYITAVISCAYKYINLTNDELVALAIKDLTEVFPKFKKATLVHTLVIKERKATLSVTPEIQKCRPDCETGVDNLFLAGDWINTGLPATIEGAVQSGYDCARRITDRG